MIGIGLDFETYGSRNLMKVGLDNYLSDPEFRPLIASISYDNGFGAEATLELDFIQDHDGACQELLLQLGDTEPIAVHNAGFERGVLKRMGFSIPHERFIDTALIARVQGADTHLRNAAAQMLVGMGKMPEGKELIKRFAVPDALGECEAEKLHKLGILTLDPAWRTFQDYCNRDAQISRLIMAQHQDLLKWEREYEIVTQRMNETGWPVDLASVREMQDRYEVNKFNLLEEFRQHFDPKGELNLNSLKQLKAWCADRGIRATSFDEQHVASMLDRVSKKLVSMGWTPDTYPSACAPLVEVYEMLRVKQALGGSSLKKLQVILDQTGEDGRLRNSYMHYGAAQSGRTTGRGVQMQNLPRLNGAAMDMLSLQHETTDWSNDELSSNLRQVFTASHPKGDLIVGDFKGVESRGLAYLAGEKWKLQAYEHDKDLYKVLAAKMFDIDYYAVEKEQRQIGKVGELSCGYGAGPVAVHASAKKMGLDIDEADAAKIVNDWRDTNPKIVHMWEQLDMLLKQAVVNHQVTTIPLGDRASAVFAPIVTPRSLLDQHPGALSIEMRISVHGLNFTRIFHGCYSRGRNICFYKPSGRAGGDLWLPSYTDPKTKARRYYDLYGGKLTGIITQSFCREIFFGVLSNVQRWCDMHECVQLIGQFHDEIVLDYTPGKGYTRQEVVSILEQMMSTFTMLPGFPLDAEVQASYRYSK